VFHGRNPVPHDYWSWLAHILPWVEQKPLYDQADNWAKQGGSYLTGSAPYYWWPWGDFWTNPPFATARPNPALGSLIKFYLCPSEARSLSVSDIDGMKIAFTSYLGCSGLTGDLNPPAGVTINHKGVLYDSSKVRLTDMKDGASQTLMVGERPPSNDLYYGWWFAGAGWDGRGTGDVVLGAADINYARSLGCPDSSVRFQEGRAERPCDQAHFWSFHIGGANFAMGYGSVRFVSYSAANVFPALSTRNGNDLVNDF